ncbi:hypothetical protein GMA12_00110 [Kocuria sediminis]|uniref:Right handed beta helix domain-containing protein n=1 Tax=Kocuria sediminis TaxID=1038857 RepID=A0A6N8GJZ8_9MICC|nr:right-handed parallel beta-helix repeat-containing protein [Kocuria sediminis]MUN61573.1 hypothetical protein [Kocuria sediminis]
MAPYIPLTPDLPLKSILTPDHIAHIENGITGVAAEARTYVDDVAVQIQAGQVTDAAFDAAVDRAAADGRLVVEGGGGTAPGVEVIETQPGAYQFTSGTTEAMLYGLTAEQKLPAAAKSDLRTEFTTKTEVQEAGYLTNVPDSSVATLVQTPGTGTRNGVHDAIDKRTSVINALAFGYDPTGTTISGPAVQAAIDAAAANGGGSVFVPDGHLKLSSSLKPRTDVRLFCNEGRVKVTATAGIHAFLVDPASPITGRFTVEGFDFVGTKGDPGVYPSRHNISITGAQQGGGMRSGGWFVGNQSTIPSAAGQPLVQDLVYRNCTFTNLQQPLHFSGFSGHGEVTGCKFVNTLDPSFTYMGPNASLIYKGNLTLNGGDNGVSVSRMTRNVVISDNIFIGCAYFGIWVAGYILDDSNMDPGADRFTVSDNVIFNCGDGGISLANGPRYGTISGNLVDTILAGPLDAPTLGKGHGVRISGFPDDRPVIRHVDTINVTGNTFRNIARAGIGIRDARNVRIGENLFVNVGRETQVGTGDPIASTDTQYNCGIYTAVSSSLANIFIVNNTFIDERQSPLMNYGIPDNLAAVARCFGNQGTGLRNPLNEPLTAGSNVSTNATMSVNGQAGTNRRMFFQSSGSNRWEIRVSQAETGSNNGSLFQIMRYSDTGSYISTPFQINRSTGEVRFGDTPPVFTQGLSLGNDSTVFLGTGTGTKLGTSASKMAFYGGTPIAKPSLTYSKAGETAAEAQLRGVLVALGLVTDNTLA